MICSNCKGNNASFFYTQKINGIEKSVALCKSCAEKMNIVSPLSPLFASFLDKKTKTVNKNTEKRCNLCALTINDIVAMGKVGCPECYNTFKDELENTIRSIHGSAKHVGLTASGKAGNREISEEEKLRAKLEEAIRAENYEEAARLRDKIKALKEN